MLKRTLSLCLALLFALLLIPPKAHALTITDDIVIIEDQARHEQIDQLFALRGQYELDFETNQEIIDAIDLQLVALGVEIIPQHIVHEKFGITASPMVNVGTTYGVQWTSRRAVTNYNGINYELQIIEGVPTSANSPLRRDSASIDYRASGITAGTFNAIKTVGASAVGAIPIVGSILSAGITAYDAFSDIQDSLTTNTVIDHVSGVAMISFTTHERYIYAKVQGSSDSDQLLCYTGNRVTYNVSTISVVDEMINGQLHTYHNVDCNITDYSESKYYSSGYFAIAAQNYHTYRFLGNVNFTFHYQIQTVTFDIFGLSRTFTAPYAFPLIDE